MHHIHAERSCLSKHFSHSTGNVKAVVLLMLSMCALMVLVLFIPIIKFIGIPPGKSFFPQEMEEKKYVPVDVVGDLGGMPVTIPHYFANYLEYEDDPSWGERRTDPVPVRNHQSKIVSFGFNVRFPDMAGLSNKELEKNFENSSIYTTNWIRVSIHANKDFGDGLGLQRIANSALTDGPFSYQKQKDSFYGLEHYQPLGARESDRVPFKINFFDQDFFYDRNPDGIVKTFIKCSNVKHDAAPCNFIFILDPNLKISVDIAFRRGLLPNWMQMKKMVSQLLLSFKYISNQKQKVPSPITN